MISKQVPSQYFVSHYWHQFFLRKYLTGFNKVHSKEYHIDSTSSFDVETNKKKIVLTTSAAFARNKEGLEI